MNDLNQKAREILLSNLFMTLATVSSSDQPWSTPVFYAIDDNHNFYWYSRKDTRHSQNIKENEKVSASLFSTSGGNEGVGIYIEGIAFELKEDELKSATQVYANKSAHSDVEKEQLTDINDFLDESALRMYKLVPSKIYISGEAKKWNGKWIDKREEIEL